MIVKQDNIALQRSCGKEFCKLGLKSLFNVKNRKKKRKLFLKIFFARKKKSKIQANTLRIIIYQMHTEIENVPVST